MAIVFRAMASVHLTEAQLAAADKQREHYPRSSEYSVGHWRKVLERFVPKDELREAL